MADNLNERLKVHVEQKCKDANVGFDNFDIDFIVGVQMAWLTDNNAALTGRGVRRFRKK